ncbi:hypothetical protein ACFV8E_38980 [Streptomyces sp. NPDC059849]|uniref:hypothetical protein n=1 Tax=Streptomyces sp. NPDC059849 TaxID=3346969 RepID=UPI0036577202
MTSAPITVHQHSSTGGRRVTAHAHGHDEFLGTAFSDHDLVVFLEAAGIPDADTVLDDPRFIEWRGGHADLSDATATGGRRPATFHDGAGDTGAC